MPSSHTTIPTPNPIERALLVEVEESVFAQDPDIIQPVETAYKNFSKAIFSKDYEKKFADYIYTGQQGAYGLLFAKPKTVEQANVPFRTTKWMDNHRWPPVLLGVVIIEDYGAPRTFSVLSGSAIGTGSGPTYYDQVEYIPDVSEGTRFVKDEFFGPRPFNIPQYPVPTPTAVTYTLPGGVNGSFPECLHPLIEIPPTTTSTSQNVGGVVTAVGTSLGGQRFPATNFESWAPYVKSDIQEQRDGGWYRVRIRVFPPAPPEAILLLNN